MKPTNTRRKIAESVVGAAVGAAIAGPAGAVAGGIVVSQASGHAGSVAKRRKAAPRKNQRAVRADLKRILVPLDFSEPSRRTLRFAKKWAERFGAEIVVLHVMEPTVYTFAEFGAVPVPAPVEEVHRTIRGEMEKIVREEFSGSKNVTVRLREGVPYDEISKAAGDLEVDLIIIATHGRTGLAHVLLGSTAERVVRHSPCPVLTLQGS